MNPLIPPPAMGQIEPLLFFNKDGFDIKLLMKVDMPLNKETKPNHSAGLLPALLQNNYCMTMSNPFFFTNDQATLDAGHLHLVLYTCKYREIILFSYFQDLVCLYIIVIELK